MNHRIELLKPILTAHLFPKLDGMLVELLRSLAPEDWEKQTVSPKWKVKDVAAHLLDTSLRGVSIGRDGYVAESPRITSAADLAAFINRLNSEGVAVYRRLSPLVLTRLVEDRGVEIRSQGDFYGNDTHRPEQAIGRVDFDRAGDAAGFCGVADSQRGAAGATESEDDV